MRLSEFFSQSTRSVLSEMRTDSEAFENLDRADKWLARYTYEALDRWPPADVLDALARRYPVESTTIYRGMNFRTQETYDEFIREIKDGILTTHGITSWSPQRSQVESFAVTRPSYFLDRETMRDHSEAQQEREYINGYRGIVLTTEIEPGQGIDVNKSRLGHENEIILLPGSYKVSIENLKKYRHAIEDGDRTPDDIVDRHDPNGASPYENQFYEYVLHHHGENLSDSSKRKIFARLKQKADIRLEVDKRGGLFKDPDYDILHIFYPYHYFAGAISGFYTDEDYAIAEKDAAIVAQKIARVISQNPNAIVKSADFDILGDLTGNEAAKRALLKHIGQQYRDLEVEGRAINDLPGEERQLALRKHMEKVKKVMGQLGRS